MLLAHKAPPGGSDLAAGADASAAEVSGLITLEDILEELIQVQI